MTREHKITIIGILLLTLTPGCGSNTENLTKEISSPLPHSYSLPRMPGKSEIEPKPSENLSDAPADSSIHNRCYSRVRFEVTCRFEKKLPDQEYEHCSAKSAFIKSVTCLGGEVIDQSELIDAPRFEVQCDRKRIVNVIGFRFTELLGTRIQPETHAYPALILPENSLTVLPHTVLGHLEFGCETYAGCCMISSTHLNLEKKDHHAMESKSDL